ncbi:alpha-(1-_6)-mannopyranosyltransferase A [Corynebacterium endometrii]|uniref:Alpha-(1->6)-mannopyranosyltransferase A n=1 Tax=Corynebacterium endometrii TaxID=2488819 RepID=A0A4P7QIA2_9CORY|nr:alpha-(1->6)-mannopyranosyltransferase A [Corynebacterium endometrii]QCB28816.1 hypothetical protein CENDO_07710 [Corynebacterium endometrii]
MPSSKVNPQSHAPAKVAARAERDGRHSPLSLKLPHPLKLGIASSIVLTLASFGGGATRNRGGVLEALNLGFVSYGHGRNFSMLLFWVGLFGLVAAWVLAGRELVIPQLKAPTEKAFAAMRRWMWMWIAPLALAGPLASRDVYSYLMQGAMVRDGFDPYSEGAAVNPGPFLLEVSQDWRNTTTPYGPLHLWLGEGIVRIAGNEVWLGIILFKVVSLLGFFAIAWAVPKIATRLGSDPTLALWLGVANPVMILHLIGGMHNESVMVALVSVGLVLALNRKYVAAIALIAVAVSMKATAFIAMPFVVWMMVNRFAPAKTSSVAKQCGVFIASGAAMVALTVAVVAAVTWASGTSWGWIFEITGNSKVINPLAGPTLMADVLTPPLQSFNEELTYNSVISLLRSIAMVLMLAGMVAAWWLFRKGDNQAIVGTAAAYQVAFIFNSVTLPWYYASVITLVAAGRVPLLVTKIATAGSFFVAVSFAGDGNHQLYNWWWVIVAAAAAWFITSWIYEPLKHPAGAPGSRN